MHKSQKGLAYLGFLSILIIVLAVVGFVGWDVFDNHRYSNPIISGETIKLTEPSQKICQLTGEYDRESQPPSLTLNQTASRYGLSGTDNGSSFEYDGNAWFLFGDSVPTDKFDGKANSNSSLPRTPQNNDSIAYSSDTVINGCLGLNFITNSIGAYANPRVSTDPGQKPVPLRTNEVPEAGITEGSHAYVVFGTDNTASNPTDGPSKAAGGANRTVVSVATNISTASFKYLYDLSTNKFTYASLTDGNDGYIYIWGAHANGNNYRHSPAYLARKPDGSMAQSASIQFFSGLNKAGKPQFSNSESSAIPLFKDQPENCIGELSVQWNSYLGRWVMLYNCADNTATNPRGVYLRVASNPWGPWSAPTTVFATKDGLCLFIHKSDSTGSTCDALSDSARLNVQGGDYSPYMIGRFTTGGVGISTIYFTMSTWNPYQVILMSATIKINS